MMIGSYEIDVELLISLVKEHTFHRILLQLPDGLKQYGNDVQERIIREASVEVFISGDSCFGACDLPCFDHVKYLGIDAVFHIGHTKFEDIAKRDSSPPVFFISAYANWSVEKIIENAFDVLIGKTIAVVTTAQHLHQIPRVESLLRDHGFKPVLFHGDDRISTQGQVLGCNVSVLHGHSEQMDSVLYVGSGLFHPIGILLSTNKPVIVADPFKGMVFRDELLEVKDRLLRRRYAAIASAQQATSFGVILSSKPGQQQVKKAEECMGILRNHHKEAMFLVLNQISPFLLENFPFVECFVSTACPRIVIDDADQYKKTMITPIELEIAFDMKPFEEYMFDEMTIP